MREFTRPVRGKTNSSAERSHWSRMGVFHPQYSQGLQKAKVPSAVARIGVCSTPFSDPEGCLLACHRDQEKHTGRVNKTFNF